jgi:hypothetical protein
MEAQAAGLRIVTSPVAALNETVAGRGDMIEGDWRSPEYAASFVGAVVNAMREYEGERKELQQYARQRFGLDSLAAEWSDMLEKLCAELRENVMPKFTTEAAE